MYKYFIKNKPGNSSGFTCYEGQTSEEECSLLFDLAKQVNQGCIVEIGCFRGRSTIALAKGMLAGNPQIPLYAIDPHENFTGILGGQFGPRDRKAFFENILAAGVAEVVRLVNLSSEVIVPNWNQKVSLLWIDGDHTYEGVKRDFLCWEKHLLPFSIIAFHDSLEPKLGPFMLINELINDGMYNKIRALDQTTVIQKMGS